MGYGHYLGCTLLSLFYCPFLFYPFLLVQVLLFSFSSLLLAWFRPTGQTQAFLPGEVGSPPSGHEPHAGFMHTMGNPSYLMPHFAQSSPSRLGQQPLYRFNQGRPAVHYNESHAKAQSSHSTYNTDAPNSAPRNGASWGRRGSNPIPNIPPTSRTRKDYKRVV